ncbi:MAG TPA: thiamine pyrophosphate-dependent dehydrogenase E1 component subunit alpha [Thermoflexales bacterium]|nr:thiamine pyrophosphate-dependent dehydrogenase E1 component subunit alpha [Anaerolineae bacterium]HQV27474.1 thiamine pyrophosphate-dependent dehydrogenase E1 component subunit alpha [Thermoflexales bacterium]HQX09943.1 thiamine pyrophosphate-dependent dehydrogenase E1 component subunit alpha [Thermoflexales bacterium]HQY23352.1 thiamine pyrophosphate-dependent dehydrogenase E1 component subunit alpha [Thermoflexales bacterium]HQZ52681.1 thiamine pyrophosphate-dependent dehydrogenase E1 comp
MNPSADYLSTMLRIRAFEEKAEELYALGRVHGTMHLSIGQEATAVGVSSALREGDFLLNTHRGHGHCLAWFGSDVNLMMAEFMGREAGYCRGRGGSMHIANVEANNLGANGIVGGGLPMAAGVGMSIKMRKTDQVCVVIFGDGASNEGAFHESLNLSSIWKLPVIYVCENNQYAMSMDIRKSANVEDISQRACAYNIRGITVDGNDLAAVHDAIAQAAAECRAGQGPVLVECKTYRWRGHSKSDRQLYRTRDEVGEWQRRDPIPRYATVLGLTDDQLEAARKDAQQVIDAAVVFAENSPEPDLAAVMEGVYA